MTDLEKRSEFNALLKPEAPGRAFAYIDPPFNFNAPDVAIYPAEVSGNYLLNSLCRRLGWSSLSGRRLLDFGCGVRFARTIVNLGLDIGLYAGIDVNKEAIAWLQAQVRDPRFRFENLDMFNPMYREEGAATVDAGALEQLSFVDFDAACMFSVITHQAPEEARLIFSMLHRCVKPGGALYFTAFVDETTPDYAERNPDMPRHLSTYHPDFLIDLVTSSGWRVEATYLKSPFQQGAFVCRKPPADAVPPATRG